MTDTTALDIPGYKTGTWVLDPPTARSPSRCAT